MIAIPADVHFALEGPIEVRSMPGSVAGGEPHIDVTVHDTINNQAHVGHLEPGSRCCYRVELGLIIFEGVHAKRLVDPRTNLVDIVQGDING